MPKQAASDMGQPVLLGKMSSALKVQRTAMACGILFSKPDQIAK
jgi:hypothetical protein